MPETDLSETIKQNATAPAKASGDAGSVEMRPISETIEAERYLAARNAVRKKGFGIRKAKVEFGGA